MSASQKIANFVLLPELILEKSYYLKGGHKILHCSKKKMQEYCPYCASGDHWTHEYRIITVKDAPIRGKVVILKIKKRRLRCKSCNKTFNEPIPGIMPRGRYTQRFKRSLNWACQNFRDLKKVRKAFRCSTDTVYKAHYQQLELNRRRKLNYPWPKTLGIDEHAFRRASRGKSTTFATMIVDFSNKRPMELLWKAKQAVNSGEPWVKSPGVKMSQQSLLTYVIPIKSLLKSFFQMQT